MCVRACVNGPASSKRWFLLDEVVICNICRCNKKRNCHDHGVVGTASDSVA